MRLKKKKKLLQISKRKTTGRMNMENFMKNAQVINKLR